MLLLCEKLNVLLVISSQFVFTQKKVIMNLLRRGYMFACSPNSVLYVLRTEDNSTIVPRPKFTFWCLVLKCIQFDAVGETLSEKELME